MGSRINHRGYLVQGFPRLEIANKMLLCLMDKKCPQVIKRMNQIGVFMAMFTPGWFLTAFQSLSWPPELQLRIFERFLFYGTRGLLGLGFAIIMVHADLLEKAEMGSFLRILQHPDESDRMRDWHTVIAAWDKYFVRKKVYQELLIRCDSQPETEAF